ncbi:MAG: 2-dehydro-3-deoxygalactonokinase [Bacteroidota bacterium]
MHVSSHFISIDWGTTHFRMRLVATETLEILWEMQSAQGVKHCFADFNGQSTWDQQGFFTNFLRTQLLKLPVEHQSFPVVASGMGSSNIGLCELPYARFPLDQNGSTLVTKSIPIVRDQNLLLISGIQDGSGMMRGEETQAIGLVEYISSHSDGWLLLPGTHSKHMAYGNGIFHKFGNYMTGELFQVLGRQSILATSVEDTVWDTQVKHAFLEGFTLGSASGIGKNLLRVRTRDVVGQKNKKDNYFFLSGLLIGDELGYLKDVGQIIFLAASGILFELYKTGLETLIGPEQLVLLDNDTLVKALLTGQRKMLLNHAG